MAEQLSAGVFIEERSSNVNIVQPVSTSTLGIVGVDQEGSGGRRHPGELVR